MKLAFAIVFLVQSHAFVEGALRRRQRRSMFKSDAYIDEKIVTPNRKKYTRVNHHRDLIGDSSPDDNYPVINELLQDSGDDGYVVGYDDDGEAETVPKEEKSENSNELDDDGDGDDDGFQDEMSEDKETETNDLSAADDDDDDDDEIMKQKEGGEKESKVDDDDDDDDDDDEIMKQKEAGEKESKVGDGDCDDDDDDGDSDGDDDEEESIGKGGKGVDKGSRSDDAYAEGTNHESPPVSSPSSAVASGKKSAGPHHDKPQYAPDKGSKGDADCSLDDEGMGTQKGDESDDVYVDDDEPSQEESTGKGIAAYNSEKTSGKKVNSNKETSGDDKGKKGATKKGKKSSGKKGNLNANADDYTSGDDVVQSDDIVVSSPAFPVAAPVSASTSSAPTFYPSLIPSDSPTDLVQDNESDDAFAEDDDVGQSGSYGKQSGGRQKGKKSGTGKKGVAKNEGESIEADDYVQADDNFLDEGAFQTDDVAQDSPIFPVASQSLAPQNLLTDSPSTKLTQPLSSKPSPAPSIHRSQTPSMLHSTSVEGASTSSEPSPAPSIGPSQAPAVSLSPLHSESPSSSPSLLPPVRSIIEQVALQGGAEFDDSNSYQSQALEYLESTLSPKSGNQYRYYYALACIYTASFAVQNKHTETEFSTDDIEGWMSSDGWMTDSDFCGWYGVSCDEENLVKKIELGNNRMFGIVAPEIQLLAESIEVLDLSNNTFLLCEGDDGNEWISKMVNMEVFYIGKTAFEYDGIPTFLNAMTRLKELDVSKTMFTNGPIRGEAFQGLESLSYLDLSQNQYTTTLPDELIMLPNLEYLYLVEAVFKDVEFTLDFITQMPSIFEFWVDRVPISGGIPTGVGDVLSLAGLSATFCGLEGTIPTEMGNLIFLQQLFLYQNNLTGSIPTEFANLGQLQILYVDGNALSGSMPDQVCSVASTMDNIEFGVDCNPEADVVVGCTCCTCCGPELCGHLFSA